MIQDVVAKIYQLPADKLDEVEHFLDSLLDETVQTEDEKRIVEQRERNMGRLKGKIWMADDFDETPEDFKDYV